MLRDVLCTFAVLAVAAMLHEVCSTSQTEKHEAEGGGGRHDATFLSSDSLGISHCRLQGSLGDEFVTLHVWLRVTSASQTAKTLCAQARAQETCNRTALAHGFLLVQSNRASIPYYNKAGIQLLQSKHLLQFSQQLFLRSYVTGAKYPLQVVLPFSNATRSTMLEKRALNTSNTKIDIDNPKVKGQGWTSHVLDITGTLVLQQQDLTTLDYELTAVGFDYHCPVLLEPPVLGPCSEAERTPGCQQHVQTSSLTSKTQVWQVLAPFHSMDVRDYATMLWHRVSWHKPLGVTKYLLYVYESLSPLIREPLIQELVTQGHLVVVLYTDMPKHEEKLLEPTLTDIYVMQVLAYNHALLALWGQDILVLVADIDEYVITRTTMTVVEAYKSCRNLTSAIPQPAGNLSSDPSVRSQFLKRPVAGLQLRRTDALCSPASNPQDCSPTSPGLTSWVRASPHAVAQGQQPHPLTWHGMTAGRDLWDLHNTKMLVDPNLSRDIHVHFFQHTPGTVRETGDTNCIRLLHLVDLYRVRHTPSTITPAAAAWAGGNGSSWWWPAQVLNAQHSSQAQ